MLPVPGARWVVGLLALGSGVFPILTFRTTLVEPFRIPAGSMAPTLQIGDHVLVAKYAYALQVPLLGHLIERAPPSRGDVLAFRFPEDRSLVFVKRVVGVGGDQITVEAGQLLIGGVRHAPVPVDIYPFVDDTCDSTRLQRSVETLEGRRHLVLTDQEMPGPLSDWPRGTEPFVVPEGTLFMMGDNRDYSADSRQWGVVPVEDVLGRVEMVWFSLDSCAGGIRTERLFTSIDAEVR